MLLPEGPSLFSVQKIYQKDCNFYFKWHSIMFDSQQVWIYINFIISKTDNFQLWFLFKGISTAIKNIGMIKIKHFKESHLKLRL